jgi:5-methylthioribose kinase
MQMLELTADNAEDYLRQRGVIGPEPARVTLLGWGVSNVVLRVEAGSRLLVLKQSRPQLRTRAAWFSDLDRVYREQEVMEYLEPRLPAGTVPRVLFSDRDNFVFAMSHAPLEAQVWKETLLAGDIAPAVGERTGLVLGRMHAISSRERDQLQHWSDRRVFVQLRVDPFYRSIQKHRPELADRIEALIQRMQSVSVGLCHGDYSPKNILVHAGGFTLVDYETAHLGDPGMDLGFFLSHLLLKSIKRHPRRQDFFALTRGFWASYRVEAKLPELADLIEEGIAHCGVCLLARIDGVSPVDYLPEEPKRELVRTLGGRILLDRITDWDEVLALLDELLGGLEQ